jgi:diacylglycerol kinase (CTP)
MDIVAKFFLDLTHLEYKEEPSSSHVLSVLLVLIFFGGLSAAFLKSLGAGQLQEMLSDYKVNLKKIARTVVELERKTFHMTGLFVPATYELAMRYHFSKSDFVAVAWMCTLIAWSIDVLRLYLGRTAEKTFPFTLLYGFIREKERRQLCGTSFFSLGCTVAITLFPPAVASVGIMWLVIGDMSAALIGVAFGGDVAAVKLGREGKKSVEGSVAMFLACMVVGMWAFSEVYMAEYAIVVGSLVATLVELYEPLGLNDNLTIPVSSCFALEWALARIRSCQP